MKKEDILKLLEIIYDETIESFYIDFVNETLLRLLQ